MCDEQKLYSDDYITIGQLNKLKGKKMKKKKPEDVAVEAVNDLFIRDIEKLLFEHKKYDHAAHLMKLMGMNKKEISKIVNEVKKGVKKNEANK